MSRGKANFQKNRPRHPTNRIRKKRIPWTGHPAGSHLGMANVIPIWGGHPSPPPLGAGGGGVWGPAGWFGLRPSVGWLLWVLCWALVRGWAGIKSIHPPLGGEMGMHSCSFWLWGVFFSWTGNSIQQPQHPKAGLTNRDAGGRESLGWMSWQFRKHSPHFFAVCVALA